RLGTLAHLGFRLIKGSPERYVGFGVPWMLDPAVSGGGPLRNFGIHVADQLNWQLGPRAARVAGAGLTRRLYGHGIEDFGAAVLRTDDGIVVTLEVGYSHAAIGGSDNELRVAAAGAYLVQRGGRLEVQPPDGEVQVSNPEAGHSFYRDIFFDALRRF